MWQDRVRTAALCVQLGGSGGAVQDELEHPADARYTQLYNAVSGALHAAPNSCLVLLVLAASAQSCDDGRGAWACAPARCCGQLLCSAHPVPHTQAVGSTRGNAAAGAPGNATLEEKAASLLLLRCLSGLRGLRELSLHGVRPGGWPLPLVLPLLPDILSVQANAPCTQACTRPHWPVPVPVPAGLG